MVPIRPSGYMDNETTISTCSPTWNSLLALKRKPAPLMSCTMTGMGKSACRAWRFRMVRMALSFSSRVLSCWITASGTAVWAGSSGCAGTQAGHPVKRGRVWILGMIRRCPFSVASIRAYVRSRMDMVPPAYHVLESTSTTMACTGQTVTHILHAVHLSWSKSTSRVVKFRCRALDGHRAVHRPQCMQDSSLREIS